MSAPPHSRADSPIDQGGSDQPSEDSDVDMEADDVQSHDPNDFSDDGMDEEESQNGQEHSYYDNVDMEADDVQSHDLNDFSDDGTDEEESQNGDQGHPYYDMDWQGLPTQVEHEGSDIGVSDRGSSYSAESDLEGSDDSRDDIVQDFPPYHPYDLENFGLSVVAETIVVLGSQFPHSDRRFMETFRRLQHHLLSALPLPLRTSANRVARTRAVFVTTCDGLSHELSLADEEKMSDVKQVFEYILTTLSSGILQHESESGSQPTINPPLQEVTLDSTFLSVNQSVDTRDDNHQLIRSVRFPMIDSRYSPYCLTLPGNPLTDEILRKRIMNRNLILRDSVLSTLLLTMTRKLHDLVQQDPSIINGPQANTHRRNFDEAETKRQLAHLITDEVVSLIKTGDRNGIPISASNLELRGPFVSVYAGSEETQSRSRCLEMRLDSNTPTPRAISDRLFLVL